MQNMKMSRSWINDTQVIEDSENLEELVGYKHAVAGEKRKQ
jgi:hypothetical protein